MAVEWTSKDPEEVLDYDIKWAKRLDTGDVIESSTWSIAPTGLIMGDTSYISDATKIWVSGGTEGVTYSCTNQVVTQQGRTMEQTVQLRIKTR